MAKEELKYQMINTENIYLNEGQINGVGSNPRTVKSEKFKKLVESITHFPEMLKIRPIIIDENFVILGGNMRYKACLEVGLKEIPVIKIDTLTAEQKKEFLIKDNVSFGEWDWDLLSNEWNQDLVESWGVDAFTALDLDLIEIEEVDSFSESVNFSITCENLKQLEELQSKLNINSKKITFETFIIKAGL